MFNFFLYKWRLAPTQNIVLKQRRFAPTNIIKKRWRFAPENTKYKN